jgi:hypothetical protein
MDERRAYLKELASRSARRWGATPLPPTFAGETRIETRNTVYELHDGVCTRVTRREDAGATRNHPSAFVGMRVVGWLMHEAPRAGISLEWRPGAYAVLWRPREDGEEHSAVALTSSTMAFRQIARTTLPPAARTLRLPALARPPTPVSIIPPPPPSMTRLHMSDVPPAPETPTPVRRTSSVPPPLPARAYAGLRPSPARVAPARAS